MTISLETYLGHIVAYVGAGESDNSSGHLDQVKALAEKAAAAQIDTLVFRRGNGTLGVESLQALQDERDACHAAGVGYLPYMYCYGPKFGVAQVVGEAEIAKELALANGCVVLDLEAEYDNQHAAAQLLANSLQGIQGSVIISTWANPRDHSFPIAELDSIATAWQPQIYDNYLQSVIGQLYAQTKKPCYSAIDLNIGEFGADNPLVIAGAAPSGTLFVWELEAALKHADILSEIRTRKGWQFHAPPTPPPPDPPPTVVQSPLPPVPVNGETYFVQEGDNLSDIAARHQVTLAALKVANRDIIAEWCRNHNQPFTFDLIWPGEPLFIPR